MEIQELDKRGTLFVADHIIDGTHMRITREFLVRLISSVIGKSFDFRSGYLGQYKESNYPLRYNERGLNAVFMSAVSTLTDVYLSEIPILRKSNDHRTLPPKAPGVRTISNKGRMDCWALYRGIEFCVELKQGNLFAGKPPRQVLKTSWKTLLRQVKEAKEHAEKDSGYQDTAGVGICVVPCFEYAKQSAALNSEASQIFGRLIDDIFPKPVFAIAWEPPDGRIVVQTVDNKGAPTFEGVATVAFLCHVTA